MPLNLNDLATNKGVAYGLNKQQIEPLIHQYYNYDKFADLMNNIGGNVIIRTKKATDSNTIQFRMSQNWDDTSIVLGDDPLLGNETQLDFVTYQMSVSQFQFGMTIPHEDYAKLVTGLPLSQELSDRMAQKAALIQFKRLMQSLFLTMCSTTYDPILQRNIDLAAKQIDYSELVTKVGACGIVSGTVADYGNAIAQPDNISHQRIIFGRDFNNVVATGLPANATINATINQAGFTVANGHGASLRNFRLAKDLALIGNRVSTSVFVEPPMRPISTMNGGHGYFMNKWLVLLSSPAKEQLLADPEWQAQQTRGVIENAENQPSIFRGDTFLGEVGGMIFVHEPHLNKFLMSGAGGAATIAPSFLLGADALAIAKASSPVIRLNEGSYKQRNGLGYFETSGIRPIIFPSMSNQNLRGNTNLVNVPNSIISIFSALV